MTDICSASVALPGRLSAGRRGRAVFAARSAGPGRASRTGRASCASQRGLSRVAMLVLVVVVAVVAAAIGWAVGAGGRDRAAVASGAPTAASAGGAAGTSATGSGAGSGVASGAGSAAGPAGGSSAGSAPGGAVTPALTITTARPRHEAWPRTLGAQGGIDAWQEVVIGPEVGGMRIAEIRANVGDRVRRGDVLATLVPTTLTNDLASREAAVAEAKAGLAEASANAASARRLQDSGAISQQQVNQYLTAEQTAKARVAAAEAQLRTDRLRVAQASLQAPDDGVISVRLATPGAVVQPGQELYRLIRGGRLEWRAEVPGADLGQIRDGMAATVTLPDGTDVVGTTRVIAPTVDPATRNGTVYVDLPPGPGPRAGMFARGRFDLGGGDARVLPAAAVAVRDGFPLVFRIVADGPGAAPLAPDAKTGRALATRVTTGRRLGDAIEIVDGLRDDDAVAATGVGFLADGDVVAIVPTAESTAPGPGR